MKPWRAIERKAGRATVTRAERLSPARRPGLAQAVAELQAFVRIPSVSAQRGHAGDVRRCAEQLAAHLARIGLDRVAVHATRRHPIVTAEHRHAPGRPTLLLYGHYDVQPAEPLGEWRFPPFSATVAGPYLYGRGASDDKGQLFAHLKAIERTLATAGRLPINLVCLFEGEEEIGSPNLPAFLKKHRRSLAADAAVVSDTRMLAADRPALTYALRGGLGMELTVEGPPRDLHSGSFGGAVHNPAEALCALIAGLTDSSGRVRIPGFYDRVRSLSREERAALARTGPRDAQILADAGVGRGRSEPGFSLYEATTARPSLSVAGLTAGYQGEGSKAILPARASAKLGFRLVPDQDPEEIEHLVRRHLARAIPPTVKLTVATHLRSHPALVDRRHPVLRAAATAYRRGFGAAPVLVRSGGSIPVVNLFQEILGVTTALLGFALPGDGMHGPNERFDLRVFARAIATCQAFYGELGRGQRGSAGTHRSKEKELLHIVG